MTHPIEIRTASTNDAAELSELILGNAAVLLKPHYSDQQWEVFARYYSVEQMIAKVKTQAVFCAVRENVIVGTVALEDDFVLGFYTRLEDLRQGIGQLLMDHLETFARSKGITALQLAASPVGLVFYYKHHWKKVKDLTAKYYGVEFEETLMKKSLTRDPAPAGFY